MTGRGRPGHRLALGWFGAVVLACAVAAPELACGVPPTITTVEIVSPHQVPEARVRAAIGALAGRPLRRGEVRASLERVWALEIFSDARVEEIPEPGGVRLRFRVVRRPYVRAVAFQGHLGLDVAQVASTAALARDGSAEPDRLDRARRDLETLYRREGYLAARVSIEARADPATNARDVTVRIEAGKRTRVGAVEIRGLEREPERVVRKAFGLKEGQRYSESALRDGVRAVEDRVREDGFFEARIAGNPEWEPATNRMRITLTITEGRRVKVEFNGASALKAQELNERLTFPLTGVVDEFEAEASAHQIEALYRERGYHFVAVRGTLVEQAPDLLVRFDVTEGPRVIVDLVTFTGVPDGVAEQLRDVIQTRPPERLNPGVYREDVLQRDVRAIATWLEARGYPEARVGPPDVSFVDDRTRARIVMPVAPGAAVAVGTVTIAGQTIFSAEDIMASVPLASGESWDRTVAEEGRRAIERKYGRRGYHATRVDLETARHGDTMDVTYRIVEGPQTRIGRILVHGLVLTREHLVFRELPFQSGDPLDPEQLIEAQRRLGALGLFERVDVEPLRPPPTPFADVEITVRELKPWHVAAGGGYSTFEGLRGSLELGHDNLFGTGRSLSLKQEISERGDRTDLTFRDPRFLETQWRSSVGLFREHRREIGFQLESFGVTSGIERDLSEEVLHGLHGALRYQLSDVNRFDVKPALVTADVTPGREIVATLTPELTLERRDRALDPHRGSFHLVALETGAVVLGGDSDFLKGRFETHWFFDWLRPTVLGLSGRLGLAGPLRESVALPIEERFFAGGATTIRGYKERRVGPLDPAGHPVGGNAQLILNAELRFPLWRYLTGAVFYDTGTVTPEIRDLGFDQFKSGIGAGIRLTTPVGALRFDVGYPLNEVPNQDRIVRFYLAVGYPF